MKLIILIVVVLSLAVTGCVTQTPEERTTHIDEYLHGDHVTGTVSHTNGITCTDLYVRVDRYDSDGFHVVGYRTFKGCGDDVEWYNCLTATKDGYKTMYLTGHNDAEWRT